MSPLDIGSLSQRLRPSHSTHSAHALDATLLPFSMKGRAGFPTRRRGLFMPDCLADDVHARPPGVTVIQDLSNSRDPRVGQRGDEGQSHGGCPAVSCPFHGMRSGLLSLRTRVPVGAVEGGRPGRHAALRSKTQAGSRRLMVGMPSVTCLDVTPLPTPWPSIRR